MKWIYPYPTLFGDVTARVLRLAVDDQDLPRDYIDIDRMEVELVDLEREGWESAEVEIEVIGPRLELKDLVDADAEPHALAVLHCAATNARQAVTLNHDESNPARWSGTLRLDRSNWYGRISLRCTVTARIEGVRNRIIGAAPEWRLHLDDVPRPPVHGAINIQWDDFRDPQKLDALREYEQEPAFLYLDPDEPVLYLNRGFEGLEALLADRRRRQPGEQALHDQARATIATEAWTAMFNTSLVNVQVEEGEEPDWPEAEWQRTALEVILDRMYPDKSGDDALRHVAEAIRNADGGSVQQLVLPAISAHVSVARLLRSAIRKIGTY